MKHQRLILFCSDVDMDLDELQRTLRAASGLPEPAELEVDEIAGPETLALVGWTTVAVRPGWRTKDMATLGKNLNALARACAATLGDDVLAVFMDHGSGSARACLQKPAGFPRTLDGELFHVLRQVAAWVDADPVQMMRLFAPSGRPSELQPPAGELSDVLLSGEEEKDLDAEPEEEDRFVESKLRAAREWMERYLAAKKR